MMLLVDKWSIVSILANIFQIIGTILFLTKISKSSRAPDVMLGVGCSLAWFNITRYLMKTANYKTMINSFVKSFPQVFRALISVLPLLFGYSFLGMSIFWQSRRFTDFFTSLYTLVALMHGDFINDTYTEMTQINNLIALMYLYSYIFISICIIANIFTILIEEGFMK